MYNDDREFIIRRVLTTGDTIHLVEGGYDFEALEEVAMIEVKQGSFSGEGKASFVPTDAGEVT